MSTCSFRRLPIAALASLTIAVGACSAEATPTASPVRYGTDCPTSAPPALGAGETRTVTLATAKGTITLKIEADLSPGATGNFVALASCHFYDGVVFHRIATLTDGTPFVIQGGDPTGQGNGNPGYYIKDESVTTTYHRGTLAMARKNAPDSTGSQFFIVLDDRASRALAATNTYMILGEVTAGMDAVDAIYADADGEKPSHPIAITTVTVTNP